ncbi:26S protease regulatory subunit 4 [Cricetulus griseus]|uniref:26S protease regulatory subunit 4 n=1 Tax=Cricetulus griseus TaxID=10029 RepID=G3HBG5_CRIGR|nr:26S protease regulatory subunit 4 [Cricetulus griseus]
MAGRGCAWGPGHLNEDNARFLLLAGLILLYLVGGAAVFSALELAHELQAKQRWEERLANFNPSHNLSHEELSGFLRHYEEATRAGIRMDSVRPRWDFTGAFYFVGTVVSTIVTPHTQCRLKLLKLERIKDYLLMEEEFIRNQEQMKPLEEKQEEERSKVDDLRGTPMSVGTLEEIIDDNHAIVSTSVGSEHYVSILSFVDKDLLEPGCSVLLNHKVHAVIGVLMDDTDPLVTVMKVEKAPQETYADIGGLDNQIQEIKESVELPLTHPEYYEEMGIKPPKGVILYGPPGTGKTLLAKAVANQTSATFLRVVGSELIQKYLGDGPKLVRELFRVAEEHAPSIVFIDEIDAIGTKRKIEFPLPDEKTKKRIFQIHTSRMTLADDVTLDDLIMAKDDLSGADIKSNSRKAVLWSSPAVKRDCILTTVMIRKEDLFTRLRSAGYSYGHGSDCSKVTASFLQRALVSTVLSSEHLDSDRGQV